MATSETIVDEFDDLGFTLENPKVVDRLVSYRVLLQCGERLVRTLGGGFGKFPIFCPQIPYNLHI